jgi:hypothetical protein
MNVKTTLALLILTAAIGALLWFGPVLPSFLNPSARNTQADEDTRKVLETLSPDKLVRIEVRKGDRVTILERKPGGTWSLPGNWPTRTPEVTALAELLGGLRSRFAAIPVSDAELKKYGLDKPAVSVKLETEDQKLAFVLGENTEDEGSNRFSRPTYLRWADKPEVVRLGPGLIAALDRPTDYYQQRRLFPGERVTRDDNPQEKVEHLSAKAISIEEKKEGGARFSLVRNGDWELSEPLRDRLDPRVADALLSAVPDLWAEQFVGVRVADTLPVLVPPDFVLPDVPTKLAVIDLMFKRMGLVEPEYTIKVTRNDGTTTALLIGTVSNKRTKKVMRPPPGLPPGIPPMEQEIVEEFRYAKLDGNAQIFEIKTDKFKDVFVQADTLRDMHVVRFKPTDAQRLELKQNGQEMVLVKEKDRWKLDKPLKADADSAKVTELLTSLSQLEVRDKDIVDKADLKTYELDNPATLIKVTVEEEAKGEEAKGAEKPKKTRTVTLKLGKHDKDAKKLYVQADDWPRVNAVEDGVAALASRPAMAYRGKRVFDFAPADLAKITVQRGEKTYTLEKGKDGWKLSSPVAAEADPMLAGQLASELSNLDALDYVNDAPKADELEPQYGLGKSALVVKLEFSDKAKPARTLHVGKAREGKPGYFARVADAPEPSSVFAVGNAFFAAIDKDSLAFLSRELWHVPAEEIESLRVRKGEEAEYTLKRAGGGWQIEGPFTAPALSTRAKVLANVLAAPQCDAYKAHEAKELKEYGLDKPSLVLSLSAKDGKEHTLLVGAPIEKDSDSRFAKLAKEPAIFVVGNLLSGAVGLSATDLLDPLLLKLDFGSLERIQSKAGDTALTLERKGEEWQVTEGPGAPFVADEQAMSSHRAQWLNFRADRFAAYGDKVDLTKYGLNKPAATMTISGKDVKHVVELGSEVPEVPGARFARLDSGPGVAVLGPRAVAVLMRTHLDYVNRTVLKLDADAVAGLLRQMGTDTLELAKKDEGWRLVKPADNKADDKSVQDLVNQLAELRALRVVEFPAKDVKAYGLDAPKAVVTLKPGNQVLKLGKEDKGDVFAQVEGNPAVVVLPGDVAKRLTAGPLAYRDRAVAKFADADKMRLERGPRKAVFSREDGSWKLTEPLTADAEQDDLDDFVNTLAKLRADELVAEKPTADELKKYGLDKPEARYRLQAGDKDVLELLVGTREKDGRRCYAKLAGNDLVFLLDPKLTARALGEFRPRKVWSQPLDALQIESVRFNYARNPFTLEKTDDGWQVAGKPDLKPNPETVNETLAAVANLKLARYAVDKGADAKLFGLETPELVLEVITRTGKRTLHIGSVEGDSKRRYARLPGGDRSDVFVLDEADVARIVREAAAFTKAPSRTGPLSP